MARETTTPASKQGQNCGELGSFDQAGTPRPRRQAVPLPDLRTCIGAPEKAGWQGSSRTACLETGGVSQAAGPGCVRPGCGTRLRPCMISRKTPTRRAGAWEDWAREGRGSAGMPAQAATSDDSSRGCNARSASDQNVKAGICGSAQERRSLCTTALYFSCCVAVCVCGKDDRKEAAQRPSRFSKWRQTPHTHVRHTTSQIHPDQPLRAARHDA